MKQKQKRWLAVLLTVCMVFTMTPVTSLAEQVKHVVTETLEKESGYSVQTPSEMPNHEESEDTDDWEEASPSDAEPGEASPSDADPGEATPGDANRTEAAERFADGVKSLDAEKLMALAQAYVDAAKELAAYTNQEPELIQEEKRVELQKKFEDADAAFWPVYDTVNGQAETSLLNQYEALSEEEKESVAEEYQTLEQVIQKVEALLAVMYGAETLAAIEYPVVVNNVRVTDVNMGNVLNDNGSVIYTPAGTSGGGATLKLTNATITTAYNFSSNTGAEAAALYTAEPLNIVLSGQTTIKSNASNKAGNYGIYSTQDLTITGASRADSLTVTGGTNKFGQGTTFTRNERSSGINLEKNGQLTVSNVTLKAYAGENVCFRFGSWEQLTSTEGIRVAGTNIVLKNADVTAGGTDDIYNYGLLVADELVLESNSKLTAGYLGKVKPQNSDGGCAVRTVNGTTVRGESELIATCTGGTGGSTAIMGSVTLEDGKITATAGVEGNNSENSNIGIDGPVIVHAGTLTAAAGKTTKKSAGIIGTVTAIASAPSKPVCVIATGGESAANNSMGIYGDLNVGMAATVTATSGKTLTQDNYGVFGATEISNGGTLTAIGGPAADMTKGSYGISGPITVHEGGTLIAQGGGDSTSSFGLLVTNAKKLTIDGAGAVVKSSGGTQAISGTSNNIIVGDTFINDYIFKAGQSVDSLSVVKPSTDTTWVQNPFITITPHVEAPEFAADGDTYKMETKTDTVAHFAVTNAVAAGYAIYNAQTGGTLVTDPVITPSGTGFILTYANAPQTSNTYYVCAKTASGAESDRVKITVTPAMESESLVTDFQTNVADISNNSGVISTAENPVDGTIKLPNLQYGFQNHIAKLPVKLQVSKGATVTASSGAALKPETIGSELYWTGTYDFSEDKTVTFTVTSEDESSSHTYVVSASILTYKMAITPTNSTLTSGTSGDSIAWMQPINTVFTANTDFAFSDASIEVMISGKTLDSTDYTWTLSDEKQTATLSIEGTKVTYDVNITVKAYSTEKKITGFAILNGESTIDETAHTVKVSMPYGTELSSLTPTITLSAGATVSPESGASQDFESSAATPIEYTVTAEDGSTQVYDVTAEITVYPVVYALSKIETNPPYPDTVRKNQRDWTVTLKAADNCIVPKRDQMSESNLKVTMEGDELAETTDYTYTPNNDGLSATIAIIKTVTGPINITFSGLSTDNRITSFTVAGQSEDTVIDHDNGTIKVKMPAGTDLTKIAPEIEIEADAKVTPKSGSEQNFADYPSIAYTVTAENGDTKTYRVTVKIPSYVVEYPYAKHITKISGPTLVEQNREVKVVLEVDDKYSQTTVVTRGETTLKQDTDYTYSYDSGTRQATITIPKDQVTGDITITTTAAHSLAELKNFHIDDQAYAPTVTKNSASTDVNPDFNIDVEMLGTVPSLNSLSPTFTLSENAICNPASSTANNFTDSENNRVVYTVTSQDESTVATYRVKVTKPSFTITYTNTTDNMTDLSVKPATAGLKAAPSIQLYALMGYSVPKADDTENLTVTMGGVALSSGHGFTYSPSSDLSSATLTITEVTGNVEVYVKALNQKNVMSSFDTNRKNGNDTGKEITPTTPNGYHMKLSYNFANDLADLPIKLEVSSEAAVTVGDEPLSKTTIDGNLYWIGRYDFTENAPITFTVTSEDGTPVDYVVTAEIPSYAVTYDEADHITRTDVAGDDVRQWLQPLTVKFQADAGYVQQGIKVTVQGNELADTAYTFDYNEDSRIGILNIKSEQVTGAITITPKAYSKLTKLTNFTIEGQVGQTETDGNKIHIQMPFGSDLSAVTPKILTLSEGATSNPDIKTAVNFETAADHTVSYTVTAEDGVTEEIYQVKVTIPTFTITYENENMEKTTLPETGLMDDPEISLKAQKGFSVPTDTDTENLTVTMGGVGLTSDSSSTEGYYTYVPSADRLTAMLTIHGVTGNVEFHVKALNQATELVSVNTNRAGETDRARKSEPTDDGFHLTLPTDFNNNMSSLPIKLEVSHGAAVKVAGAQLSETMLDGKLYWTGSYDFTSGTKITFTVTPEDGGTPKDYIVTAEIPSYEVKYADVENITRTVVAGDTARQWLQPLEAVFTAAENHEQQGITVTVNGKTLTEKRDYTFDYDLTTRIGTLAIPGEQVTGEITITPKAYNNLAELTEFKIPGQVYDTEVDPWNNDTLMIQMPYDADLKKLNPTFELSEGATSDPESGAEVNLAVPYFYYRVTAEDGHTQEKYRLKVSSPIFGIQAFYENLENPNLETTVGLMEEPEITLTAKEGYSVPKEQDIINVSVVMENRVGVSKTLTQGTEDGQYTYTPSKDQSSAVLTIHGVRGHVWINVKALSNAKDITEFTVANQVGDTRLNEAEGTIAVDMPYATDLKALAPTIMISDKATVASPSDAERDFSDSAANPVIYTVTAEDSTTKEYAVTITIPEYQVAYELAHIDPADLPNIIALKQELQVELKAEDGYSVPEKVEIQALEGENPVTLTVGSDYNYTPDEKKDRGIIVFAKDLSAVGDLTVTASGESRMKQITGFTMAGQTGSSVINEADKTITAVVAYGTDLTKIAPEIVVMDNNAAVEPGSGVPRDFTESRETPLIYTMTAGDGSTQEYQVTVRYPEVKVTFDSKGGTQEAQQDLIAGDKAKKPAAPVKETDGTKYYAFDGWYADAGYTVAYDFEKPVPEDITIYAKWKVGYKVMTEAVDGTVVTSERDDTRIFYPGETITVKATENSGYRFKYWNASADAALLTDPTKAETTFIMPEHTVSLTASFIRKSSGGSGGSGGSSGGSSGGNVNVGTVTTTPTADGGTMDNTVVSSSNGSQAQVQVKKDAAGNVVSRDASVSMGQQTTVAGQQTTISCNVDANLVKQAAQTAGATSQSTLQVTIPLPTAGLVSQLQSDQTQSITVTVVVPTTISGAANIQIRELQLEKSVVEAAKEAGKDITITVKNENGIDQVSWSFSGAELKASGVAAENVNLAIDLTPVLALTEGQQDLRAAVQPISTDGLVITFHHSGVLPATARIRIPSTVQRNDKISTNIQPGDVLRLYYFNPQTKRLEAVGTDTYTVDAQSYITVALNHCSDYVLIPMRSETQGMAQAPAAPVAGTHTIQAGDNLWKIANRYGCSVNDLIVANPGVNQRDLRIGQVLKIPVK